MFYSEFILAKKGPLGRIWLAAHWSKKLTRQQILAADINDACKQIIQPTAPLALRTSGHLLLGVARIHDYKQKHLMDDCSEALVKIKLAFRSGPVQVINPKASASQITLTDEPANFDEEKFIGDLDALNEEDMGRHLGRVEDITMQEDYGIGEMMDDGGLAMDGFGEGSALPGLETEQLRAQPLTPEVNRDAGPDVSFDPYDDDTLAGQHTPLGKAGEAADAGAAGREMTPVDLDHTLDDNRRDNSPTPLRNMGNPHDMQDEDMVPDFMPPDGDFPAELDLDRTLVDQALDPLEAPAAASAPAPVKLSRRKRQLVIDESTELSNRTIKAGLLENGPDDITRVPYSSEPVDFLVFGHAPPTKRALLHRREFESGVESLLSKPCMPHLPEDLLALFRRARNKTGGLALPQLDDQDAELTDVSDSEDEDGGYAADTTHDVTNDGNQGIMDEYPSFDNYVPPINEELEPTPVPDARKGGVRDQDEDDFIGNSNDQEEPQAEDIDKRTGWTKRTQRVKESFEEAFTKSNELKYKELTGGKSKRYAAHLLFEMLVLAKEGFIRVEQPEPLGDIDITPTDKLVEA